MVTVHSFASNLIFIEFVPLQVFHNLIGKDRDENQGELSHFLQGKAIHIHVRRNFIYEDAFDKLSPDNGNKITKLQVDIF